MRTTTSLRPNLVIVGGGFAGVAAASSAAEVRDAAGARDPLDILLISADPWMTIRPRLYEADPADARVRLDALLDPLGVQVAVGRVTDLDPRRRVVHLEGDGAPSAVELDGLVLATGSRLRRPAVVAEGATLHDVDTYAGAIALRDHVRAMAAASEEPASLRFSAIVVGAGLAGIETATELAATLGRLAATHGHPGRQRITLVDPAAHLAELLGAGPAPALADAFAETGVELMLGRRVAAVEGDGVVLGDGTRLDGGTVVWTAGLEASALAAQLSDDLDGAGRIRVDRMLRVPGSATVFAAGDVCAAPADGHTTVMSCQHAIPTGQVAGHNAAASLLGRDLRPFDPDPYVTCVDLGAAGGLFTSGWDREPQATGEAGKRIKRRIIGEIHPSRWMGGIVRASASGLAADVG